MEVDRPRSWTIPQQQPENLFSNGDSSEKGENTDNL